MNSGTTIATAVECTGADLTEGVQNVLNEFANFSNISSVFMTEGSWRANCDLEFWQEGLDDDDCKNITHHYTPSGAYNDMLAFVGRYTLLMASVTSTNNMNPLIVNQQHWNSWSGSLYGPGTYGTLCDSSREVYPYAQLVPPCYSDDHIVTEAYGATAYGSLQSWFSHGSGGTPTIALCTVGTSGPCSNTANSIWTATIVDAGGNSSLAVWTWDNTTVTCTASGMPTGCPNFPIYSATRSLAGAYGSIGLTFPVTEQPILLITY